MYVFTKFSVKYNYQKGYFDRQTHHSKYRMMECDVCLRTTITGCLETLYTMVCYEICYECINQSPNVCNITFQGTPEAGKFHCGRVRRLEIHARPPSREYTHDNYSHILYTEATVSARLHIALVQENVRSTCSLA